MAGANKKVVLIGDYGVGKTSLFHTFTDHKYVSNPTRAEYARTWEVDGNPVTVSARGGVAGEVDSGTDVTFSTQCSC